MMGDIGIFNDYQKSMHVRERNGKRVLIIASREGAIWQERELSEDKITALVIAMDQSISFEEARKKVNELIGNVDEYCTDYEG